MVMSVRRRKKKDEALEIWKVVKAVERKKKTR